MLSRMLRYLRALLTGRLNRCDDLVRPRADVVRALRERESEVRELVLRAARDPEEAVLSQERSIEDLKRQVAEAERLGADEETLGRYWSEIDRKRLDLITLKRIAGRAEREKRAVSEESNGALVLRGRNQRGVPIYEGRWRRPSAAKGRVLAWLGPLSKLLGVCFIAFSFVGAGSSERYSAHLVLGVMLAGFGYIWGWAGNRLLEECAEYDRLFSIDELCQRFEIPELTLLQESSQRGITPKRIINGREYFDFQEFGEAAVLLRAAKPPEAAAQDLLRPASSAEQDPEILLRVGTPDGNDKRG